MTSKLHQASLVHQVVAELPGRNAGRGRRRPVAARLPKGKANPMTVPIDTQREMDESVEALLRAERHAIRCRLTLQNALATCAEAEGALTLARTRFEKAVDHLRACR